MRTITKFFILFFLAVHALNAQNVRTITEGGFFDDLFLHPNGILYGSDFFNNTIWEFDTATEEVSIFRNDFTAPNGIAMNPQEELYICDHFANTIYKMDTDGTILETYGSIPTPSGVKNIPNTNDMVFVEYGTNKVGVLSENGDIEYIYQGFPLNGPAGIAYIDGVLYVSNYNDRKVMKLENNTITTIVQLPAEASANNFLGFIDSKDGSIYATSIGGNKIYKINPEDQTFVAFAGDTAGNQDGPLDQATFNAPNGILFDTNSDRLYISDGQTRNLRIIEDVSLGFETPEVKSLGFKIFPNPVTDSITIQFSDSFQTENAMLSIIDISGRNVFSKNMNGLTNENLTIDVSDLSSGNYLMSITKGSYSQTLKFIK